VAKSNFYFILSSHLEYLDSNIEMITNSLSNKKIFRFDGSNFFTEQIENINLIYSQKNTEGLSKIFIIENFSSISKRLQSKLLVLLENILENNYFIFTSKGKAGILPTLFSRAVVLEDFSLNSKVYDQQIEKIFQNVKKIIESKDIENLEEVLNQLESIIEYKEFLSLSIENINNLFEKNKQDEAIDKMTYLHTNITLLNSIAMANTYFLNFILSILN